jgi:hypothetical protein
MIESAVVALRLRDGAAIGQATRRWFRRRRSSQASTGSSLPATADLCGANDGETWVQAQRWVTDRLGEERLAFLATRPLDLTLELDGVGPIRFCHGAPERRADDHAAYAFRNVREMRNLARWTSTT